MDEKTFAFDEQVFKIMNELEEECDSPTEAMFILLICLYELAMANNMTPEEAIEGYKKTFLSIERVYEDKLN